MPCHTEIGVPSIWQYVSMSRGLSGLVRSSSMYGVCGLSDWDDGSTSSKSVLSISGTRNSAFFMSFSSFMIISIEFIVLPPLLLCRDRLPAGYAFRAEGFQFRSERAVKESNLQCFHPPPLPAFFEVGLVVPAYG
jgi:hypothetical protein